MKYTIAQYLELAYDLDRGDFNVTKWEADFLENVILKQRVSSGQAEKLEEMEAEYLP